MPVDAAHGVPAIALPAVGAQTRLGYRSRAEFEAASVAKKTERARRGQSHRLDAPPSGAFPQNQVRVKAGQLQVLSPRAAGRHLVRGLGDFVDHLERGGHGAEDLLTRVGNASYVATVDGGVTDWPSALATASFANASAVVMFGVPRSA